MPSLQHWLECLRYHNAATKFGVEDCGRAENAIAIFAFCLQPTTVNEWSNRNLSRSTSSQDCCCCRSDVRWSLDKMDGCWWWNNLSNSEVTVVELRRSLMADNSLSLSCELYTYSSLTSLMKYSFVPRQQMNTDYTNSTAIKQISFKV